MARAEPRPSDREVGAVGASETRVRPRSRRWVVLAAAIAGALLTARLGFWQLHRAAEKIALQTEIEQRSTQPALPQSALAATAEQATPQHYRPVVLHGRWLAGHTVYLDNRQMNAVPGFYVVTPLLLGNGDAVLVQRGWVPRNFQDRTALPPIVTASGEVEVRGLIAPPPSRLFEFSGAASGPIRQNLDLDSESREIGMRLRPVSVQQSDDAALAGDGLLRQWPHPAVDVSKHYGYAFQWFSFSALIAGLYVWFQLVRPRIRRAER